MQRAVHILSGADIFSFNLEAYEKKAIVKACQKDLIVCPQCLKPVQLMEGDFDYLKHKKPNEECELSLSDEKREVRIEKVQAAIVMQLNEIYFDEDVFVDIWQGGKRYHIITPYFKIRIFNEIHPYNYMNDNDINIFVTDYQTVYDAETIKHRGIFYGYNINKNVLIMYNFEDEKCPISYCPVGNFYIDELGHVYRKNFIADGGSWN